MNRWRKRRRRFWDSISLPGPHITPDQALSCSFEGSSLVCTQANLDRFNLRYPCAIKAATVRSLDFASSNTVALLPELGCVAVNS